MGSSLDRIKLVQDKNELCRHIQQLIEDFYRQHKYGGMVLDFSIEPKVATFPDGSERILTTSVKAKIHIT